MTVHKADGTAVTKANLDTSDYVADDPELIVNDRIYETTHLPGSTRPRRRLLARDGERVKQSTIDSWFPAATVTGRSPASGTAAGGTVVTLTGTNLAGVSAVTFGGTPATAVSSTETTVTCTTAAHAAGAVTVVVSDDSGDVSKPAFFTYT